MNLFFSYSRAQKDEVVDLVDFLSIYHEGWFDSKIGAGNEWWKEILSQIRNCDVFVFVLSEASNHSKACMAELKYANALGKHMVILQVDEIDPAFFPTSIKADNISPYFASEISRKNRLLRSLKEIEDSKIYIWDDMDYENIPLPSMPISELSAILSEIKAEEVLSLDEQEKLLNRIERLISKEEENPDLIQKGLKLFKKRIDINYLVGKKIDRLLISEEKPEPISDSESNTLDKQHRFTSLVLRDVVSIVEKFTDDKNISSRLKTQQHNPNFLFGSWRLQKIIQNGQTIPPMVQELIIFNNNYAFQLIQNNLQANYGSFMYNQEFLTINFWNGMMDTRSYQCFQSELYLIQYMNNVAFNVYCYTRSF